MINALKHAFPDGRHGTITMECVFPGPNWTLVVSDNGVGVPTDRRDAHEGLGATIVRVLAKELGATVELVSASPGTKVTVARTAIALVDAANPNPKLPPPAMPRPERLPALPHWRP